MRWSRVFYIGLAVLLGLFFIMQLFSGRSDAETISLKKVADFARQNRIESILVQGDDLEMNFKTSASCNHGFDRCFAPWSTLLFSFE